MARTAPAPRAADTETEPLFNGLFGTLTVLGVLFAAWAYTTPYAQGETLDTSCELTRDLPPPARIPLVMPPEPQPLPLLTTRTTPGHGRAVAHPTAPAKPADAAGSKPRSLLLQQIGTFGDAPTKALFAENVDVGLNVALDGVSTAREASLADPTFKRGHIDRMDARIGVGRVDSGTGVTGDGAPVRVTAPTVLAAPPEIPDGDDRAAILRVMQKSAGRVTSCLDQALKADPHVSGRIGVGFTIVAGRVTEAHLVENGTRNDALGACVTRAVHAIRFDAGLSAEVANYPWIVSGG